MPGKIFPSHITFDPYPGKYSFPNWNEAVEKNSGDPQEMAILTILVKGNFYYLMNTLLGMVFVDLENKWVNPRKR